MRTPIPFDVPCFLGAGAGNRRRFSVDAPQRVAAGEQARLECLVWLRLEHLEPEDPHVILEVGGFLERTIRPSESDLAKDLGVVLARGGAPPRPRPRPGGAARRGTGRST